jgi:outer membrane lipase/esterase
MTVSSTSFATRRQALHAFGAAASSAMLAACGSGSTFEPLVPSRFVSFGDGWSDLGQTGSRFTVNDGSVNIWVQQMAAIYGRTITAQAAGGLGFAQGGARVNTGANSITDQITAFLAANTIATNDVLVIDAGVSEMIALASSLATTALNTAVTASANALAVQVRRLVAAGGKHVVIANAPDIGKTPFGISRAAELLSATRSFNDALKTNLADITSAVLLIDNEAYVNTLITTPGIIGAGAVVNAAACTPGVNTSTCTTATAVASYNVYLYADDRHPAPGAARLIGSNAYNKVKERW